MDEKPMAYAIGGRTYNRKELSNSAYTDIAAELVPTNYKPGDTIVIKPNTKTVLMLLSGILEPEMTREDYDKLDKEAVGFVLGELFPQACAEFGEASVPEQKKIT
jgi:hypothetical protein